MGSLRPRSLADITDQQLTIAPSHVVIDDLRALKEKKYPNLSWTVDPKLGTTELLEQVKDKKLAYTIADSVAISLFQRVHPEIAVALDVTDEQPVTWFTQLDDDQTVSAAMLDFFNSINEDGTRRVWKRNISVTVTILITLTPAPSCARWIACCRTCNRCSRSTLRRLTGSYWRQFPIRNRTGMLRPPPHGRARVDDADQKYRAEPRH